ncbi:hypothetical protein [Oscillibacter sp.]|uniref:hypothetical protein n=1 Tax=Oscillibacter sp. TaxID=1945593 RepID=UPI0028A27131|nr:hypothetical protein [Oscillibacter sp.]
MSVKIVEDSKPKITSEEDAPFDDSTECETEIPSKTVSALEKKIRAARKLQNIMLKDKGFRVMLLCITLASGTYVSDCILINRGMESSSLMTGFFEMLKFIISILIGFVFAKPAED